MRIEILGCSGGIGGTRHTTAILVDDDMLVDAGTGVMTLELDALARIDHVFLTHTHLDHVTSLPLMIDTVGCLRDGPVVVHATEASLEILRGHIFNWRIWPDFCRIPTPEEPFMACAPLELGDEFASGGRRIRPLPVNHTVPAVGFQLSGPDGSLVFSGDTTCSDAFWQAVNAIEDLKYLIIETAFSESEHEIAVASKHLCPSMLAAELEKFSGSAEIYITHLKPREEDVIMEQVQDRAGRYNPRRLQPGQVFTI